MTSQDNPEENVDINKKILLSGRFQVLKSFKIHPVFVD